MPEGRIPAGARGALFFSASLFLLFTLGVIFQTSMGIVGIVLTQVTLFLGLAVLFARYLERRPLAQVFRLRPLSVQGIAKSVVLGTLSFALIQLINYLITMLVGRLGGTLPELYRDLATSSFALALVTRALLPAICEEMAYRGYVLWSMEANNERTAVVVTGLLFGMMHLSLIRLLPLALLGMIFAMAVRRSGSIYPGMIMHFTNNAIALGLTYFVRAPQPSLAPVLVVPLVLVGILVLGAAVFALARSFGPGDRAGVPVVAVASEGLADGGGGAGGPTGGGGPAGVVDGRDPAGAVGRRNPVVATPAGAPPTPSALSGGALPGLLLYLYAVAGELLRVFAK